MLKDEQHDYHFEGFDNPTTTPTPDMLFDEFLAILSGAELKVLLYIVRRTFGFKKNSDPISFNQFLRGISTKDGRVLDRGCGLKNRTALSDALKGLLAKGIIAAAKSTDERGENETTVYSLRFKESGGVVRAAYYRSTRDVPPVVRAAYPQETVKQETVQQQSVVVANLRQFRIAKEKARDLAETYATEYIQQKIDFLEWSLETKHVGRAIEDRAAWLIRAIEENYQPPEEFKTSAQRAQEAEERAREAEALAQQEAERERREQAEREQQQQQEARYLAKLRERYGTSEKELTLWPQVLEQLKLVTSRATYQTWFPRTQLLVLQDGQAVIGVPNEPTRQWLEHRLSKLIKGQLTNVVGQALELSFEVIQAENEESRT